MGFVECGQRSLFLITLTGITVTKSMGEHKHTWHFVDWFNNYNLRFACDCGQIKIVRAKE